MLEGENGGINKGYCKHTSTNTYIQIYLECQTISCMFATIDDIEGWNRQDIGHFVPSQICVMLVQWHALQNI